jgi:hypothetical protein
MEAAKQERTGVLVLRAWVEADGDYRLRIRITRITGSVHDAGVEPMSTTFASTDDACAMVRVWLEDLQHGWQPLPPLESH